ncbi:YhgE/Pip family protein [Hydrogenophaga sp. RWCD_12]|uniref:YhgE/Pip family protein n=1 Tax=Hydrogenophaga sp. RWCD_12 TaxID=3391190 RepID=UPI00398491EF
MRLFRDVWSIAAMEAGLFRRFPKLRLSVLGIVLIPALYALIYLSAVWDPSSRTAALPALIVNLDQGIDYKGQHVDLGDELVKTLQARRMFGFTETQDEETARRDVRAGRSLFALIIPADFSAHAVPGEQAGGGKLVVYASEGNNYTGAGFARRFAAELGHQVNETLNEKRWALVLGASAGAADSMSRLRDGVGKLQEGAHTLRDGLQQADRGARQLATGQGTLDTGIGQFTSGMKQLGAGIRTMDARKPAAQDLQALKSGASQLSAGHAELSSGLAQLEAGSQKLSEGALHMKEETQSIPLVGGKVSAGAQQLAGGAEQLTQGLRSARQGQAKLQEGAQALDKGVSALADGMGALSAGIGTMASALPPDAKLDALADGGHAARKGSQDLSHGITQLADGSRQLAGGLDLLSASLPAHIDTLGGTAKGLAVSVQPEIQIDAPVANNGSGFAPNFLPVAVWLGAVMTTFIFHLRMLPGAAASLSPAARLPGKLMLLGGIVTVQALVVVMMAAFLLQMHILHLPGLALTLVTAALTFLLIIMALVRAFGDAGKAVALILLILQLSSAGGVVPIELSSDFFREINPWLPFTWVVRGVRASMFGAFDSQWLQSVGIVMLFGLGAFVLASFVGRWRFVDEAAHRPALDV